MLQKYMPLIFGFIYLNVAAILNVYFIVSSAIRIVTQEILFRKGIVAGPGHRRRRGAAASRGPSRLSRRAADSGIDTPRRSSRSRSRRVAGHRVRWPEVRDRRSPARARPVRMVRARQRPMVRAPRPTGTARRQTVDRNPGRPRSSTPGPKPKERERRATRGVGGSQREVPRRREGDGPRHARCGGGRRRVRRPERTEGGLFGRLRGEARVQARVRPVAPPPKRTRRRGRIAKRDGGDGPKSSNSGNRNGNGRNRQDGAAAVDTADCRRRRSRRHRRPHLAKGHPVAIVATAREVESRVVASSRSNRESKDPGDSPEIVRTAWKSR